jgi:thiol-disulfide isomerase/thioredoxin
MAGFYSNISKFIDTTWLVIIILILLFMLVGYYGYKRFFVTTNEKYTNVANANRRNPEIVIFFFFADWCPHCTKSKPEWVAFSSEYDGKTLNNYKITCTMVNCTDDSDPKANELMAAYDVNSFPTVILVKDNNAITYEAKIKRDTLESFIISATSS